MTGLWYIAVLDALLEAFGLAIFLALLSLIRLNGDGDREPSEVTPLAMTISPPSG